MKSIHGKNINVIFRFKKEKKDIPISGFILHSFRFDSFYNNGVFGYRIFYQKE